MRLPILSLAAVFFASHAAHAGMPIAPGAAPVLVADGFKFTEGPAADSAGNVYFTDQPNDRIMKWSAETGQVTEFMKPAGRSNGLYFDRDGKLLACADEKGELWRIDVETKEKSIVLKDFDGKLFNGPNDLWVAPNGGIYFTDPFYKRDYWTGRGKPDQEIQRVYYLAKGADKPAVVEDTLKQPNGIVGSPDGKTLFVADIGGGKTYRYEIAPDHTLRGRKLFCEMGSDGVTLDSAGNVYLTGKGVTVFNNDGEKLGNIPIDKSWTANACFGGKDGKTLFITAMDSVFTVKMAVSGTK